MESYSRRTYSDDDKEDEEDEAKVWVEGEDKGCTGSFRS